MAAVGEYAGLPIWLRETVPQQTLLFMMHFVRQAGFRVGGRVSAGRLNRPSLWGWGHGSARVPSGFRGPLGTPSLRDPGTRWERAPRGTPGSRGDPLPLACICWGRPLPFLHCFLRLASAGGRARTFSQFPLGGSLWERVSLGDSLPKGPAQG
jgi:hypothetical protein